jgi:DNA-directed RNA polymerase subunit alpha
VGSEGGCLIMDIIKKGFQLPKKINFDEETLTDFYGKLVVEPLERGFGTTIGNSLRRILLSSIEGAAVTAVRIPGALHEFSTIKGVKEDVVDIVLNIKKLRFKVHGDSKKMVTVKAKGHKIVKGADIEPGHGIEVLNKDCYIATVDSDATLEIEMYLKKGKGYVSAEMNKEEGLPVDAVAIDSVFSPIKKVNFWVDKARVGRATDYDRLIMEIWTDSSISPKKAVSDASSILIDHLDMLIFVEEPQVEDETSGAVTAAASNPSLNENLLKSIDELELSVRAFNCLKSANVKTIGDLVQRTEREMLRTKNFGRKSLNDIKDILNSMGLHFGMKIKYG